MRITANTMTLVGFITRRELGFIKSESMPDKVAVYCPLSYQIGGYTLMLPADQLNSIRLKKVDHANKKLETSNESVYDRIRRAVYLK
ncbi:MAG: hypothetical protein PF442_07855 [Desulfobulbaceae bacterium]|jgi:uncharacterized membrane protein|nr:hypothetical protein [Desulfobulbaceae bacterium]